METATEALPGRVRAVGVVILVALLGFAVGFVVVLLAGLGLKAVGIPLSPLVQIVLSLACVTLLGFGGTAVAYVHFFRGRHVGEYVGIRFPTTRDAVIVVGGWFLALCLVFVAGIIIQTIGVQTASNEAAQLGKRDPTVLLLLVPASLLIIGPGEELMFRGVVQRRLTESFSTPVAVTLTAVLFASIHYLALVGSGPARFASIAVLLFPAFVLGTAYAYTKNLVVSMLIHGSYDATIFAMVYIVVKYAPTQSPAFGALSHILH